MLTTTKDGKKVKTDSKVRYASKIKVDDLIADCYVHLGGGVSEYQRLMAVQKDKGKGVEIMSSNVINENVGTTSVSLDKLSPKQLMFFVLYNSPDYYDIRLNLNTYLDEVATYLVVNGMVKDEYKKYGKIINIEKKYKEEIINKKTVVKRTLNIKIENKVVATIDGHDITQAYSYIQKEYSNIKGNFLFNDAQAYVTVKRQARAMLNSKPIQDAMKEMVSESLGDKDYRIQDYYNKLDEIYKNTKDEKVRLECLKLGGKWLGMENVTINTNQSHLIKGLEVANASIDFGIDDSEFEKVE